MRDKIQNGKPGFEARIHHPCSVMLFHNLVSRPHGGREKVLATSLGLSLVAFAVHILLWMFFQSDCWGERLSDSICFHILFACSTIFGFEMHPLLDATKHG